MKLYHFGFELYPVKYINLFKLLPIFFSAEGVRDNAPIGTIVTVLKVGITDFAGNVY